MCLSDLTSYGVYQLTALALNVSMEEQTRTATAWTVPSYIGLDERMGILILSHYRLIIVDDDPLIRSGLRTLVEALGMEVIGEADNGQSGIERAESLRPELILLDVSMPVMGGFAAARELRKLLPELRIIFVSQYNDPAFAEEALRMGAAGYVVKQSATTDLSDAVVAAMAGRTFVSHAAAARHRH